MKGMLVRVTVLFALVAAIAAVPALADKGGVPHNGGGDGNSHSTQSTQSKESDEGTQESSGQSDQQDNKSGSEQQKSDDESTGDHHSTPNRHSSHSQEHSVKTQTTTPKSPSSHAHAGKTTICHATGSSSNPYVKITPSNNAIPAHRRHQDGRDVIPANGDCPGGTAQSVKQHGRSNAEHGKSHGNEVKTSSPSSHAKAGKTPICHATGSATNPYVEITISNNALPAHQRHQDGRDIIPAPQSGCPGAQSQTQGATALTTLTAPSLTPGTPAQGEAENGAAENKGAENEAENGAAQNGAAQNGAGENGNEESKTPGAAERHVLGASTTGSRNSSGRLPSESLGASASGGSSGLPFTGWDLGIVAAIGLAALLAGTALRRAARSSRVRS